METTASAIHIAEIIDIQSLKGVFNLTPLYADNDEIFLQLSEYKYLYAFKYGIICVYNFTEEETTALKQKIYATLKGDVTKTTMAETIEVVTNANTFKIEFETITIPDSDSEKLRLIMLNLSQSVALDFYYDIAEKLLEDTRRHTSFLEEQGKLNINGKKLKRYIGKVLNIKNKISENLYIFESHELATDDEDLNKFNLELKKKFDLVDRHQIIHQQVDIVKENLDLFKDIMFHSESSRLEWIIIILIVIEVIDLLVLKIINI